MVMCYVVMWHVSCVMCHVSCVMFHASCVICHVSCVTFNMWLCKCRFQKVLFSELIKYNGVCRAAPALALPRSANNSEC